MPRMSLELVVVAIIILVVALVVLTIFGGGMTQIGQLTNARNTCESAGRLSCVTSGQMPSTWSTAYVYSDPTEKVGKTCAQLLQNCKCTAVGNNYQWGC